MAKLARLVLFLYSAALIGGGIMGYIKAQSQESLIAGCVTGGVALLALLISFKRRALGLGLGTLVALATGAMMLKRFLDKGDNNYQSVPFMVAVGSGVTVVILLGAMLFAPRPARN